MIKSKLTAPFFVINVLLLLNNIRVLAFFYFRPGVHIRPSHFCVTAYEWPSDKSSENPGMDEQTIKSDQQVSKYGLDMINQLLRK